MAILFEDLFIGTGLLAGRISDSGHAWEVLYEAPADTAQVSAGLVAALFTGFGFAQFEARSSEVSTSKSTVTVESEVIWTSPPGAYGFVGIGVRSAAGTFEFTIQKGTDGYYTSIDAGGVGYVPITNFGPGTNLLKAQLDIENNVAALFVNNVQIYYGPKAQSLAMPFGAYVAFNNGGTDSDEVSSARYRYLRITDDAPQPPVVGAWWTNIIRATEIP